MKTSYERIIDTIRREGSMYNEQGVRLGQVVDGNGLIDIGNLTIDSDDYLIDVNIKGKLNKGDKVLFKRLSSELYVIFAKVVKGNA